MPAIEPGTYERFLKEFDAWPTRDLMRLLASAVPQVDHEARHALNTLLLKRAWDWQAE